MRTKRILIQILAPVLAGVLWMMVGCGRETPNREQQGQNPPVSFSDSWKQEGFRALESEDLLGDMAEYWIEERVELPAGEQGLHCYDSEARYSLQEDAGGYVLWTRGAEKTGAEKAAVELPREAEGMTPVCMDAAGDREVGILLEGSARYLLVFVNPDGTLSHFAECTEGFREAGILPEEVKAGSWRLDHQGKSYLICGEQGSVACISREGKLEKLWGDAGQDGVRYCSAFRDSRGSLIFVKESSGGETILTYLDTGKGREIELARMPGRKADYLGLSENGQVYYFFGGNLMAWDVTLGTGKVVFRFTGSGILEDAWAAPEQIFFTEGGGLCIFETTQKTMRQYLLSDEVRETAEEIRILDIGGEAAVIKGAVTEYNLTHKDAPISYEAVNGFEDAEWNRVLARISAGDIPDIMILHNEMQDHFQTLYEKGVLMEVEDLLTEETKSQLFPGIRDCGTMDGQYVGIVPYACQYVLSVSDTVWPKDRWTCEEVMELIGGLEGLKGITVKERYTPGRGYEYSPDAMANLEFLILSGLDHSPFLDRETGKCFFESDELIRSLRYCTEYGKENWVDKDEMREGMKEGEYLCRYSFLAHAGEYAQLREDNGEDFHLIGFPGQEQGVGYWKGYPILTVKQDTGHLEEIKEFLQLLLGFEFQKKIIYTDWKLYGQSVREDVIRDSVYSYQDLEGSTIWRFGKSGPDFMSKDGESYLEDYIEFLRNLSGPWPLPYKGNALLKLVDEELENYLNGKNSAERTAEQLQNRVQLYLDENE